MANLGFTLNNPAFADIVNAPPPAFDADTQERDAWTNRVEIARQNAAQAANLESRKMSRDDFLKKYALGQGGTFLADDKGGNSASEVAGQSVADYYDNYLAEGVAPRTMSVGGDGSTETVPWNWGGGTTRDALKQQIGLDAWSNVNPHPESNQQDGWNDAWQQIGKPIAMGAAMYSGIGALGGVAGGAGAAGTGAATTGTTAATGAGTAAAATPASGLAGYMGMNTGYGATALNSGALNAGMSLARGNNIGDSLKSGATAALLSPVGTMAGQYTGSLLGDTFSKPITSGLSTIAGNTVAGGAQGAINGRGVGEGMQTGFMNGLVNAGGNYVGGIAKNETGSKNVGDFTNQMTTAALQKAFAKPPPPRKISSNGNLGLGNR